MKFGSSLSHSQFIYSLCQYFAVLFTFVKWNVSLCSLHTNNHFAIAMNNINNDEKIIPQRNAMFPNYLFVSNRKSFCCGKFFTVFGWWLLFNIYNENSIYRYTLNTRRLQIKLNDTQLFIAQPFSFLSFSCW